MKIIKTIYQLDYASMYVAHDVASIKAWDKDSHSSRIGFFSFCWSSYNQKMVTDKKTKLTTYNKSKHN
jgi:hypothetical protein